MSKAIPTPNKFFIFLFSLTLPFLAGAIGSISTSSALKDWYPTLEKSPLNPPNWIFGPVWTTLYLLMGIALFLVISQKHLDKKAITIFITQLILNTLWSIVFFGMENPLLAVVVIIALIVTVIVNIKMFLRIHPLAGYLLIPYLLWISFASYLNLMIAILN